MIKVVCNKELTPEELGRINQRRESLEDVLQYFLKHHVEDPIDGTWFDCEVMDTIKELQDKLEQREFEKR